MFGKVLPRIFVLTLALLTFSMIAVAQDLDDVTFAGKVEIYFWFQFISETLGKFVLVFPIFLNEYFQQKLCSIKYCINILNICILIFVNLY